ncbi:maleylpyruvate isomerase family mycothiol-dependent enzyme [Nocardioides sp. Root140]|uniref:maleylpyruvate isomerase family mycothiol-dependent enzyme n=1 Tax=Nocardioides sp. Root140 TaxID=1736460 RepID=UPI0006FC9B66|nr:maleylpyruvate isomerase family mycothiol-dependent enzyme [Nocardioides sp. Root140]KQY64344.1 hypothetical protein ASD30_05220 [Nocardioides sp. Root140]
MSRQNLHHVYDATDALLRTVDGLTPEQFAAPSLLPGWSRAHVVAHLALNALGFGRAIEGVRHRRPVAVYASPEQRDADIDESARLGVDALREFLFDACGRWRDLTEDITDWNGTFERTPGGPTLSVEQAVGARWREVEIHHADLDAGFGPADWSPAFAAFVFENVVGFRDDQVDLTLETPEGTVLLGAGGTPIRGTRHDLAWWMLGRGSGEGLEGDLPTLGPWR